MNRFKKKFPQKSCLFLIAQITIILIWHMPAYAAIQRNFLNNGFEQPFGSQVPTSSSIFCWVGVGLTTPWLSDDTTAPNTNCNAYGGPGSGNIIELWFNNFQSVTARAGKTHAELNANKAGTLSQTVCMLQNENVTWALSHRGRQDGSAAPNGDQMRFYVGDAITGLVLDASTKTTGATTINSCQTGSNIQTVTNCANQTFTTSSGTSWGDYSGVFKWLGTTTIKTIAFQAVATGSNNNTVGNFIDEVYYYLKPVVELSSSSGNGLESVAAPVTPRLRVVGTLTAALPVSITVVGGTATLGADYTTPSGTATFTTTIPAGVYFGTESVATGIQIINDRLSETDETIIMKVNTADPYIISSTVTCGNSASNPATYTIIDDDAFMKLTKTTQGSVGAGTFNFKLTNVDTDLTTTAFESTASIATNALNTTVTFDADSSVSGIQNISGQANGTDVTVNENAPGWVASGSCSVTGGTNPTVSPIPISSSGAATIPAANITVGGTINCDYINSKTATLTLINTSNSGTGSFTFTPSNITDTDLVASGTQTTATVTTTAAGTATTYDADSVTSGVQPMTISSTGSAVVVTETVPPGWTLTTGNCTVAGSNPGTFSLIGNTITVPAANVTGNAAITCNFTNTKSSPTLTVMKATNGDIGTFSFSTTNPATSGISITTTATNSPTTTTTIGAGLNTVAVPSTSTNITITEATPPTGFTASNGGCVNRFDSNTVPSSFNSTSRTITINSGNIPPLGDVVCTMVNNKVSDHGDAPSSYGDASNSLLTISAYLGSVAPDDDNASFITWQGQSTANGDDSNNSADEGIAQLLSGTPSAFPVLTSSATVYSVTLVCRGNSATGAVNGWIDFDRNGQFDSSELARESCSSNNSTAGTATLVWRTSPTGLEGTMPSNMTAGSTYARFRFATNPSTLATGTSTDNGEVEDYPITIAALAPKLSLVKNVLSRSVSSDQFTVTIFEGVTSRASATTTGINTNVTTSTYTATAGTTYTFIETAAGTPVANLANYDTTYACSNAYAAGTVIASGTGTSFTVKPIANDDITCTFTNNKKPSITVTKALSNSRLADTDQFTVQIKDNSSDAVVNSTANSTTAGAGNTVTSGTGTTGTYLAASGNTYKLTEVGSGTADTNNYSTRLSCTNNGIVMAAPLNGSANITLTSPPTVTPVTGDVIVCTMTNTRLNQDYGDAPSNGTLAGSGSIARNYGSAPHIVPSVPSVYLGYTPPDTDLPTDLTSWQGQATANGDDTTNSIDEGLIQLQTSNLSSFPTLVTTDTSYSLSLRCSGTSTANTVSGWIDFNNNGSFDASERSQGTCSSATGGNVTLTWNNLNGLAARNTFARFRIASNATESGSPTGTAADGEAEDYPFSISVTGQTITGTVFKDSGTGSGIANNGIKDGTELGIAGVTVNLTNCANTPIIYSSTTTDGAGNYSLASGTATIGTVCVEETNTPNYTSTGASVGVNALPNLVATPISGTTYTYNRTIDKISFNLIANTSYTNLNFGDVPPNQFLTDGDQTGIAGSSLIYTHTFISGTGGLVAFSLPGATASPAISGWSEVLFIDSNCNATLDGTEASTILSSTPIVVIESQTICLIQKEFIPAGASQGANNTVPVKAAFSYSNSTVADTSYQRQDITTVSSTSLVLLKEVRNLSVATPVWKTSNNAKSGEILEYRVTYTNSGQDAIKNLQINDTTPAFTTFVSGLCETTIPATPTTLGLCTLTKAMPPPANNKGSLKWSFSSTTGVPTPQLNAGGSGAVTYKVKVD